MTKRRRISLVHWDAAGSAQRAVRLRRLGYDVDVAPLDGPAALRALRADPPAAVVIDLSRLPSYGRDVGVHLRLQKATRRVPLVFVDGAAAKVAVVKSLLPDAVFTSWRAVGPALKYALTSPPASPVVPRSVFEPYAAVPLAKKLGIRPGSAVVLAHAPPDVAGRLAPLPDGARVTASRSGRPGLVLWFLRNAAGLRRDTKAIASVGATCPIWVCTPKKGSCLESDISQNLVRKTLLAAGMVDYKVCAIDETWSGLLFRQREKA